jgi:hypothetical protein
MQSTPIYVIYFLQIVAKCTYGLPVSRTLRIKAQVVCYIIQHGELLVNKKIILGISANFHNRIISISTAIDFKRVLTKIKCPGLVTG